MAEEKLAGLSTLTGNVRSIEQVDALIPNEFLSNAMEILAGIIVDPVMYLIRLARSVKLKIA